MYDLLVEAILGILGVKPQNAVLKTTYCSFELSCLTYNDTIDCEGFSSCMED
jgi:hypothetical protein